MNPLRRMAVVTALIGPTSDELREPVQAAAQADLVDYWCVTDNPRWQTKTKVWRCVAPSWRHATDPRRTARYYKILPFMFLAARTDTPDYTHWLWLDACLTLAVSPWDLVAQLDDPELATFRHPQRDCIYREAKVCQQLKKDDVRVLERQATAYHQRGHPVHGGLAETAVLLRRDTALTQAFCRRWWAELERYSRRDQISFPVALAATPGLHWTAIPGCRGASPFCVYHRQQHERRRLS